MDCDSCVTGVQISFAQLLTERFLNVTVNGLGGAWYCTGQADTPGCAKFVDTVIRQGLPVLLKESDIAQFFPAICDLGVAGTCSLARATRASIALLATMIMFVFIPSF